MNVVVSQEVAFIWKIPKFSKIIKRTPNGRKLVSEQFAVGKYKWRLWLYPNGNSAGSKDSISLFFELAEKSSTVEKVLARFSIGIQNIMSQTYGQPKAGSGCFSTTQFRWFSTTKSDGDATNWGWNRFMLLSDLQNELNRIFRVKDRTLLLQAKREWRTMEEERTFNPVPDNINQGVVSYLRDAPPSHYSVKINSFSRLVDEGTQKYESATFDGSGYTWKLVLYPNGNAKRGGGGHISLYLAIEKTDTLPLGWEAYVTYRMFVYDHNMDKYLTFQDDPAVQQIRRFHQAKKESGFDRLIPLEAFNAATNGYLVDDSCVFGVEVYKIKSTGNGETVNILEHPKKVTFDWKICDFSKICKEKVNCQDIASEEFTGGQCKWRMLLYPNGDFRTKDHISLFLELVESPTSVKKVLAEFSLVINNQLSDGHSHSGQNGMWFSASNTEVITGSVQRKWGWPRFKLLSDLKKVSSGFIVNDTMLLQAKVKIMTEVTSFS
ncbi:uncharacterized protein LOC141687507 isoform X2 [Apium graveolens]|uniref:uncharacterized protein LOC141687507 isoform X2 n=1 Tax=Apium graveolens TaxID=4045 RepID=UPI003D7918F7